MTTHRKTKPNARRQKNERCLAAAQIAMAAGWYFTVWHANYLAMNPDDPTEIWRYDPDNNVWQRKGSCPRHDLTDISRERHAEVSWCAEDLEMYDVTTEEATEFLSNNENYIQEAMVEAGFRAIDTLASMDGLRLLDDEDTDVETTN
jgi:hypothetical protein